MEKEINFYIFPFLLFLFPPRSCPFINLTCSERRCLSSIYMPLPTLCPPLMLTSAYFFSLCDHGFRALFVCSPDPLPDCDITAHPGRAEDFFKIFNRGVCVIMNIQKCFFFYFFFLLLKRFSLVGVARDDLPCDTAWRGEGLAS